MPHPDKSRPHRWFILMPCLQAVFLRSSSKASCASGNRSPRKPCFIHTSCFIARTSSGVK
jgi:hypothetical protein